MEKIEGEDDTLGRRIWRNICGLRLFWISLFVLCSILLVASLVGFALVEWNLNEPAFVVLVLNFSALSVILVGVGVILRRCNSRRQRQ